MPELTFKTLEQAVTDMLRYYAYRTGITPDVTPGATLLTLFEAWGFEVEQLSHGFDTALKDAIPEAVFSAFGFARQEAQAAQVVLRFSRAAPASEAYPILAGTQAQTNGGVVFATDADATLAAGTDHVDVLATCTSLGSLGNVPAGAVQQLVALIPGVEAVTNPTGGYGGSDAEAVEAQRSRFASYLSTLAKGTIPALTAGALSVESAPGERASKALVVDQFLDGAIPAATARIYVYRPGGASQALLDAITSYLELEQRPVGVVLDVQEVSVTSVDVTATVTASDESALLDAQEAVYAFFDALEIGEDVDLERLIKALLSASEGIYTVTVAAPAADVAVGSYERAELGTLTLTFEAA